jgi:hypothetical protein
MQNSFANKISAENIHGIKNNESAIKTAYRPRVDF